MIRIPTKRSWWDERSQHTADGILKKLSMDWQQVQDYQLQRDVDTVKKD